MKNTSVIRLVIICLILFAGSIFAQGNQRWQRMQSARIDTLKNQLNLTDKQVVQVKDIFEKSREEMSRNRENNMGDPDAMMKVLKESNNKTYSEIEKVLAPEQKKKFKKIKEDWIKQSEERMKAMRERFNNN